MKKTKNIFVIIGGINLLLWGLFHLSFWLEPYWKEANEMLKSNEMWSNALHLLNIAVTVFLLAFGFIMLVYRKEILTSKLGRSILFSVALFWLARLVGELAFPGGSIALGIIFLLCVLIYLLPAIIYKK